MKQWSRKYERCIKCGTNKTRYMSKGLCVNCYKKRQFKLHPEIYQKHLARMRKYYKTYWQDKEKYQKHIERVVAYNKTPKGRAIHEAWAKKHPNYYRNYFKKLRKKRRDNHLCINCGMPVKDRFKQCIRCRIKNTIRRKLLK